MIMDKVNRYDSLFLYYANTTVSAAWLKAQAMVESSMDPYAYNQSSRCKGLTQFADATFAEIAARAHIVEPSIWNPEHAIAAQAEYMQMLVYQFHELDKALAAYNWGMGNLGLVDHYPNWRDRLPLETKNYIARIHKFYGEFSNDHEMRLVK